MAQVGSESVQLQSLKRVPNLIDLENLLAWLSNCRETYMLGNNLDSVRQVVLPWQQTDSADLYALGIYFARDGVNTSPVWTFYKALEPNPSVEWSYSTSDVALIHNMLLCFFPDASLDSEVKDEQHTNSPTKRKHKKHTNQLTLVPESAPILQGSLEKLELHCLLQSLATSRITGKVSLSKNEKLGAIYFEEGIAVHAFLGESEGHDAIVRLLTWTSGDFHVFSNERTPEKSITRRMESLLMESAALMDYTIFLDQAKIDKDTVLEKVPMSYNEYLERMKDAPPVDEKLVELIAGQLDRPSSIGEIAARLNLSSPKWKPVIYGFVKTGVIRVSQVQTTARIAHQQMIGEKAQKIAREGFINDQTGLYSEAAYNFFLQLELARSREQHLNFSLIILVLPEQAKMPCEAAALQTLIDNIQISLRPFDLMCYLAPSAIGLLLPEKCKEESQAMVQGLVQRCMKSVIATPTLADVAPLRIGIATYPDDGKSVEKLLNAALASECAGLEK